MPTAPRLHVPLIIGHSEEQQLLDESDLPAAGWVERLYRNGETLYADFAELPPVVEQLLNRKAYRSVSAELYPDLEAGGQRFGCAVRRVALLGGEQPQLKTLGDIPPVANGRVKGVAIFQAGPDGRGEVWPVEALDQAVSNFERFKFAAYSEARVGRTVVCFYEQRKSPMTSTVLRQRVADVLGRVNNYAEKRVTLNRFAEAAATPAVSRTAPSDIASQIDALAQDIAAAADAGQLDPAGVELLTQALQSALDLLGSVQAAPDPNDMGDPNTDPEVAQVQQYAESPSGRQLLKSGGLKPGEFVRAFSEKRKREGVFMTANKYLTGWPGR